MVDKEGVYSETYGVAGDAIVAPEDPEAEEHFTFKGWAVYGDETETIVENFGVLW